MAEIELADILERTGELDRSLNTTELTKNIGDIVDNIKSSQLNDLKNLYDNIKIGDDGRASVDLPNDNKLSLEDLNNAMREGTLGDLLKANKADDATIKAGENFDTVRKSMPDIKSIETLKNGLDVINKNLDPILQQFKDLESKISEIESQDTDSVQKDKDLKKVIQQTGDSKLNDIYNKLDELVKGDKKFPSDTITKILKIGGLVFVAATVYDLIKIHQKRLNGCWLIYSDGTAVGNKCKIDGLTCIDYSDPVENQNACSTNSATWSKIIGGPNVKSGIGFCGCPLDSSTCPSGCINYVAGGTGTAPNTACIAQDWSQISDLDVSLPFKDCFGHGILCTNSSSTTGGISCFSSSLTNCSTYCGGSCSSSLINRLGPNYSIQCVNMSFSQAMVDLGSMFPNIISDIPDWFGKLGNVLKYAGIVIGVIIVIMIIIKVSTLLFQKH